MKKVFKLTVLTALIINIVACSNDDNTSAEPLENAAIISTTASDYSDSDVELVDLQAGVLNGGLLSTPANYANSLSDYGLSAFGKYFYRIGKYNIDTITQYAIDAPSSSVYSYSTLDSASDATSNPYKLIFISDTKAYLIRYNSLTAWIVNPSATTQEDYKIGELNLSAYDDGDGQVEMTDGIIVDGKLYIAMQRLNYWSVIEDNAYVAVFDTATDTEIDTTPLDSSNLKGINLQTNNPNKFAYEASAGLFIQSTGDYAPKYIGGIEKINTTDYTTSIIVDDGDNASHPYGLIADLAIVSDTLGYFVGYKGWGDNALYQFNPSTGVVTACCVADIGNSAIAISNIVKGPKDSLWVSITDNSNPHVIVIDTKNDNDIVDEIETTYNPGTIVFGFKN